MKHKTLLRKVLPFIPLLMLTLLYILSGYRLLYIPTRSMEPTIMAGSFAIGKKIAPEELAINDIAVYKNGKTKMIHRIIDIDDGTFTFKGDNNENADPEVNAGDILYKVIAY